MIFIDMKPAIIIFLFLILIQASNKREINVDKAGDNWDYQVHQALDLIKKTDYNAYERINKVCYKITFWSGNYSTNEFIHNKGMIIISANDAKYKSINNIAAIIVHESQHLTYRQLKQSPKLNEELECYLYEYNFLKKIYNVEPFLLLHCEEQIKKYSKKNLTD
jgi:hypothetical protein